MTYDSIPERPDPPDEKYRFDYEEPERRLGPALVLAGLLLCLAVLMWLDLHA
jgi:hypothetical protein